MNEIPLGLSFDDVLIVPKYSEVASRASVKTNVDIETRKGLISMQVPIFSANMDMVTGAHMAVAMARLGGLGVVHRNNEPHVQAAIIRQCKSIIEHVAVGAAIGVGEDTIDRCDQVLEAGATFLCLDIAHAYSRHFLEMLETIKNKFDVAVIAGNVATPEAVQVLINSGADVVKVGIGPGAACSTRIMTGVGVPQFSAIKSCAAWAKKFNTSIIADGGIRNPGDFAKAIAAGADAVMVGSLLGGTKEAPGSTIIEDGVKYKSFRGMASTSASGRKHAEGVSGYVKYQGTAKDVTEYILGGLRSAMSYVGAKTIKQFQSKVDFVRVTTAGQVESAPHDMRVTGV